MNVCLRLVSALEVLLHPFLPYTSRKLGTMLGLGRRSWDDAAQAALPAELGPVEVLFGKIDEATIRVQIERLGRQEGAVAADLPRSKERNVITFDEFKKLELKVARILAAERVPGADKLLKLQVDLGAEQRQIVAGIAQAYRPDELVGRFIVVVTNLAPARIRGVESNGMLLAAVSGDGMALVVPDRSVPAGAAVS